MKRTLVLMLGMLLLQQGAMAANYDDEDDEDEPCERRTVVRQTVPKTPDARFQARMEALKEQMAARRADCKLRATISLDFCAKEIDHAEFEGRHRIEAQYKDDLAKAAAQEGSGQ
jgi:hypothetical protein